MLLDLIRARPGIAVPELAAHRSFSWGVLNYHLGCLQDAGLIRIATDGRHRLVYPVLKREPPFPGPPRRLEITDADLAIAKAVATTPGLSLTDLVHGLSLTPRHVYHHVKRLLDAGLVMQGSTGHGRTLHPTARLLEIVHLPPAAAARAASSEAPQKTRSFKVVSVPAPAAPPTREEFVGTLLATGRGRDLVLSLEMAEASLASAVDALSRPLLIEAWRTLDLKAADRAMLLGMVDGFLPPPPDGWTQGIERHGAGSLESFHDGLLADLRARHAGSPRDAQAWGWVEARVVGAFRGLDWGAPDAPPSRRHPGRLAWPGTGDHPASLVRLAVVSAAAERLAVWGRHADALQMVCDPGPTSGEPTRAWLAFMRASVRAYAREDPIRDLARFSRTLQDDSLLPDWSGFESRLWMWPRDWLPRLASGLYDPALPAPVLRGLCLEATAHHAEAGDHAAGTRWLERIPAEALQTAPSEFRRRFLWFRQILSEGPAPPGRSRFMGGR